MIEYPLLTIIMPAKNSSEYIDECLDSIISQSFEDWELIIVDDFSSDNTVEIIQGYSLQDSRIQLLKNDSPGIIPALQSALEASKGEFITRMDSDDVMPAQRLELMYEVLRSSSPKTLVTGMVKYFGSHQVSKGYQKYESWLNQRVYANDHWQWIYRECIVASPNWMLRKKDLLSAGGFDNLSYPEDYDLMLQLYHDGFKIETVNSVTLLWREHPMRTSRNSEHYNQEHFFRLKLRHFVIHTLGKSELVLWGTGVKGSLTASILKEHQVTYQWMDLMKAVSKKNLAGKSITSFRNIESINNFKLLIAVYPKEPHLTEMLTYLEKQGLKMGKDFWFL